VDRRAPWSDAGWLGEMTAWVDGRLASSGTRRRSEPVVDRMWARAAMLTFDTDRGRMWAKAVPEVFAHEVAVTILLADIDPGIVPPVVAADQALGRIITEHVPGPVLATVRDEPVAWTATLSRLAEVQRVLAADPAALVIAGVAAAPLAGLAEDVPRLLGDDSLLLVGLPGGLSAAEAATLRARVPELADACRALDAIGIPDSLEHGDLSATQVIVGEMGPVILDWSDGSITHPFLSAASFLADRPAGGGPGAVGEADLIDAYLAPWVAADCTTLAEARRALGLAGTVLPLHLAALYADRVLPGLERRSEHETVVPNVLRPLL
jgi:hypothetical protein